MWFFDLFRRAGEEPAPNASAAFSPPTDDEINELLEPPDDVVPHLLQAAREGARLNNISEEEFLRRDLARSVDTEYPTPECLDIDELVAAVNSGALDDERIAHLEHCVGCAGAVAGAAEPSANTMEALLAIVRKQIAGNRVVTPSRRHGVSGNLAIFDESADRKAHAPIEPPPYLRVM